jgi:uncharacterized protein (TIGR03435 family)
MERPVYELTVEKGGVKMQLSKEASCTPHSIDSPPPLPAPNAPHPVYCDFPRLTGDGLNWTLDGVGVSIEKLATTLSRSGLDRPVIDRTDSLEDLIYISSGLLTWRRTPRDLAP